MAGPQPTPPRNVPPGTASDPGYWSASYRTGDTGWDKGTCAPPIARLLAGPLLPRGIRIVVPGCGFGHEAIAAARAGFDVTGCDFTPEAVAGASERARAAGVVARFIRADLFDLPRTHAGAFDGWLEHTCFCAIDPSRRPAYIDAVSAVLVPGGFFFGLFYLHGQPGGPPYDVTEDGIASLTEGRFDRLLFETPSDSFPNRQGKERLFVFRKKDGGGGKIPPPPAKSCPG